MAKKEIKSNKEKKHFFRDFKVELKRVVWPTPKQLINNTAVVVVLVIMTALIVFALDICFDSVNKYGITKLQSMVQNTVSVEDNTSVEKNASNNTNEVENSENADQTNTATENNQENSTDTQNTAESN